MQLKCTLQYELKLLITFYLYNIVKLKNISILITTTNNDRNELNVWFQYYSIINFWIIIYQNAYINNTPVPRHLKTLITLLFESMKIFIKNKKRIYYDIVPELSNFVDVLYVLFN